MKKKANRELIVFILLIPVLLIGSFFISLREKNKPQNCSVIDQSATGCSVFFEALKELKLPVERTLNPVDSYDINSIQLVVQNDNFDINDEKIKGWVGKGGILVYLTKNDFYSIKYIKTHETKGSMSIYKYNSGYIITTDVSNITNKTLTEKTDSSYELVKEINAHSYKTICFNELYLLMPSSNNSLWDSMPVSIKFVIYQIIIIAIAFFYFKGKRFGKPLPLYEEVERTENEYLYSVAGIYKQADCYDLMFESYYKNFLKQINNSEKDWLEYWKQDEIPELNKATKVYKFMERVRRKDNIKAKDYIEIISILEQLNSVLKKRRDSYWKITK